MRKGLLGPLDIELDQAEDPHLSGRGPEQRDKKAEGEAGQGPPCSLGEKSQP